jgi:tetratricopeptide (TPR) repeat protein
MPNPTDSITLDGANHIVVHRPGIADVRIDTTDEGDIRNKLDQLAPLQLALLLQIAAERQLSPLFSSLLRGVASQKNIVQNSTIHAQTVSFGDHYHLETKATTLPKRLTLDIPALDPAEVVGRERELRDLRELLLNRHDALLVNGLGGIGKTTLARAYVHAHLDDYQHIAWVTQSPGNPFLLNFITTIGLQKNLGIADTLEDHDDIFHEIIRRLNAIGAGPNLIVLDNVESDIEVYRSRLPGPPNWHVLLTSRETIEGFTHMPLDFLKPEAALALFRKHYTLPVLTDAQILELAAAVDYHTLTIEVLAKTAQVQRYQFSSLRDALARDARAGVRINRPDSVKIERITTFLAGIFSLSRLAPDEVWLLQQFACLPSEYHSYNLLYALIEPEASGREAVFAETLHELCRKGWLLPDTAADTFKMHPVVAEVVKKEHLPEPETLDRLLENTAARLSVDQAIDNPIDKFPWIPFGKTLLEVAEKQTGATQEFGSKVSVLKNNLTLTLLEKAVHSDEQNFGPDHPSTARSYSNLATVLKDFGDYAGAKTLLEKAVHSDEQNFGPNHPSTARSYSNLALVLKDFGDYAGAKTLLEKAVLSGEQNFGPNHPSTARSYSNLALVLKDIGDYSGAKTLLEKAVHSDEQNFGPDHPSTAKRYSNLALVLKDLGEYAGAKTLLEKAVHSDEQNFGTDHPSTAIRYSNLALVLKDLGDYAGAKTLLEKAVLSYEQNFGTDHPSTAGSYSNLALVLKDLGDYAGAKTLLEKAVLSYEQNFGTDHPSTAISYSNLALVLKDLGEYAGAKTLLEKAVLSDEQNFGPDHPSTARSYSNLATVLQDLGEYAGAKTLLEKAVLSDEQNFGTDHPSTAIRYSNLATVLQALGDYQGALILSGKAVAIFEKSLPPGHPNIEIVKRNYDDIKQHIK